MHVPNEIKPIVRRADMPQIEEQWLGDLLVWLGERGLYIKAGRVIPSLLFYHQDVMVIKARHILKLQRGLLAKPVIISADMALLDGNHRAFAHHIEGTLVPYIQFGASFDKLLPVLLGYPHAYRYGDAGDHPVKD